MQNQQEIENLQTKMLASTVEIQNLDKDKNFGIVIITKFIVHVILTYFTYINDFKFTLFLTQKKKDQRLKEQVINNIDDFSTIDKNVNKLKILLPNSDLQNNDLESLRIIFCQIKNILQLDIDFSGSRISDTGVDSICQGVLYMNSLKNFDFKLRLQNF
ncbi:hypothetical protein PPERSA_11010 [Pseudocohnilembus persalinus]|uniref:Transmembrane protein n=1 Tax=Pseudocohnilembus persalinus TaxID=266149 RepID=A0A0V0QZY9_PSEPJ|nr:hypothetical protein PPERSA_11010 [Pseudocohnilembus persalinus]|eukprot:KRX07461.1 hypothetical protein PPERSA_11010 [Pseudocohnilembus persalinus]